MSLIFFFFFTSFAHVYTNINEVSLPLAFNREARKRTENARVYSRRKPRCYYFVLSIGPDETTVLVYCASNRATFPFGYIFIIFFFGILILILLCFLGETTIAGRSRAYDIVTRTRERRRRAPQNWTAVVHVRAMCFFLRATLIFIDNKKQEVPLGSFGVECGRVH